MNDEISTEIPIRATFDLYLNFIFPHCVVTANVATRSASLRANLANIAFAALLRHQGIKIFFAARLRRFY